MRVAAYRRTQEWPLVSAGGRYLGRFATATPSPTWRGRSFLGHLEQGTVATPVQSVEQIISQVNPGHSSPDDTTMTEAVSGMQLTPGYNTASECGAAISGASKTPTIETAVGASITKIAATTGPAAPFVALGGAIVSLIGAISAHHAQAVVNEQTILCQAVPAANAALAQVMTDVQSGAYSAAQGAQYLQQILSAFQSAVAPITKSCNEACGLTKELEAIVLYMTQQLSQISVSAGGAPVSASALGGIPTWALVAAGIGLFLFLGD